MRYIRGWRTERREGGRGGRGEGGEEGREIGKRKMDMNTITRALLESAQPR